MMADEFVGSSYRNLGSTVQLGIAGCTVRGSSRLFTSFGSGHQQRVSPAPEEGARRLAVDGDVDGLAHGREAPVGEGERLA